MVSLCCWAGFSLFATSKVVVVHGLQVAVASCSSLSQGYSFSPLGFNTVYMLKTLIFKTSAQTSVLSSRCAPWHHLDVSLASEVELNLPPKKGSSLCLPNSVKQPQSSLLLRENTRRHSRTLSLIFSSQQVLFISLQNIYKFNSSFHLLVYHPILKTSTSQKKKKKRHPHLNVNHYTCMHAKLFELCPTLHDPCQAPLPMGFSRQE